MDLTSIEKQLLETPISLLGSYKVAMILKILQKHNIRNFLEIGTWVGGNIHLLSKHCPHINFDTLDINDFQKMFDIDRDLSKNMNFYTGFPVGPTELESLQQFYRKHSPGVTFYDLEDFSWKDRIYDAVLVDGDHTCEGLLKDLHDSFEHIRHKGFLFVDDTAYPHIRNVIRSFCRKYHQKVIYISNVVGKDISIIRVRKKFKNNVYKNNKRLYNI